MIRLLGANVDARVVAAIRMIGSAVLVAIIAATQKVLADPGWASYSWVPIALMVLRVAEGFFDHSDPERTG